MGINSLHTMTEIKQNPNLITKAFENHPIFIFKEEVENKKQYYFKADDIGKVLDIVNIRASIQNFNESERGVKYIDTPGGKQQATFLTSQGVYRLLYNSKKPMAEKFRKWAGDILDDIIFNESNELKQKLKEQEEKHVKELQEKVVEKLYKVIHFFRTFFILKVDFYMNFHLN